MVNVLEKLSKGAKQMVYSLVLMRNQVAKLETANRTAMQRKLYKRKYIQRKGILTVEEDQRLTALGKFGAYSDGKKAKKQVHAEGGKQLQRQCRQYNRTGHDMRTCKQ
jgi:hypothetical protein